MVSSRDPMVTVSRRSGSEGRVGAVVEVVISVALVVVVDVTCGTFVTTTLDVSVTVLGVALVGSTPPPWSIGGPSPAGAEDVRLGSIRCPSAGFGGPSSSRTAVVMPVSAAISANVTAGRGSRGTVGKATCGHPAKRPLPTPCPTIE
ncbi:hypothetical protein Amir_0387 [Actinosynnema mirum DSM 43827]|uniref:Uncharacterized protein n=1 Tax=Actinosynnema mirum (strain ATCC 29888 / DSM 43827 / JCM 3225 / NBRC 14064 / NCIMB 13271 / NRRL B-12336 / IMRU 3971 / 101) TaxID=446462 RepID=C6WGN8_ACTMD|nr:hypothetical protein Amir_0387 [Actinosynnema mirum DSM 43827]